jgi:UDP-N-acetyl-D-mannosaminuronic acid dehydrogenase
LFKHDICVIGGCGRVGLPLSIAFADRGKTVVIYDLDKTRIEMISGGVMPFIEEGCDERLRSVLNKTLRLTDDPSAISESRFVIVTVGTPVEEHMNPRYGDMIGLFRDLLPHLRDGQCIILRSTVYPGTSHRINHFLREMGLNVHLAFCPERIAEGKALAELEELPQIVGAFDEEGVSQASKLFRVLTEEIVVLEPTEAELAKLFTNVWRYIQFAVANQLFMLTEQNDLDFRRIYKAVTYRYPRTQGLPSPGLTAGPCLFKDTLQLAAFSDNSFFLGHAAVLINEGLPNHIVRRLKDKTDLQNKKVGILGMAFKANSDDDRDSLSFKLKRLLEMEAREVYCTDPYVKRDYFVNPKELLERCDIVIVAAPHEVYRELDIGRDKTLVDVWNFYNRGETSL